MRGCLGLGLTLGALAMVNQACAQGTTTPSLEPSVSWRDAVTLGIAVFGALLGLLNFWIGIWRDRGKKHAEATYLALRLAVTLEAFAGACSDLIAENAGAEAHPGDYLPLWRTALPPLADYPSDGEGWKGINIKLSAAALNLRNEVAAGQASIELKTADAEWDIEWEVRSEALRLGHSAHGIAMQMREAYHLPTIPSSYAYADKLNNAKTHFDEEAEERRLRVESFRAAHAAANQ